MKLAKLFTFRRITLLMLALTVLGIAGALQKTSTFPDNSTPDIAIKRGLIYLKNNEDRVAYSQWFFMDYLQRKFKLDPYFSASSRIIQQPRDEKEAAKYKAFQRIAYPNKLVDSLPEGFSLPTAKLLMAATHCDHIPLPENVNQLIQQNLNDGGYGVTYVAVSLEFMKENGCALPDEYTRLEQEIARELVTIVNNTNTIPDLRYEAIVFLMHKNRRDLVQPAWINQIVSEQMPDGGWRRVPEATNSNDHATMLALWALLESTRPNESKEPIIRRPAFNGQY